MRNHMHPQLFYGLPVELNGLYSASLAVVIHSVFGQNVSLCGFTLVFTHTKNLLGCSYWVKAYIYVDFFNHIIILWVIKRDAMTLQLTWVILVFTGSRGYPYLIQADYNT